MLGIAAPNSLHAEMGLDGARAGKHVVCVKPFAMTIEEGEEMVDRARLDLRQLRPQQPQHSPPDPVRHVDLQDIQTDGEGGCAVSSGWVQCHQPHTILLAR